VRSVAQELSLAPNLTVAENLRIPSATCGPAWARRPGRGIARRSTRCFRHGIDADAPWRT
jgi:ABC-type sugar transport system ATPase subunit